MLLFRIAPSCERYVGIDFSASALAYIQSQLESQHLENVSLERLAADDLDRLAAAGPFDTIIINSVIQYFPDAAYLERVLKAAYARLSPGGALFVGDVRSLRHLPAFHTAIEMARSDSGSPVGDLRTRVRARAAEEGELVVDPEFFESVAIGLGDAAFERAELKPGRARNEMTAFRYDAILRKGAGAIDKGSVTRSIPCPEPCSAATLAALLDQEPTTLRVTGIRNARLVEDVAAANIVSAGTAGGTVADLRAMSAAAPSGFDPEDIRTIDSRYEAVIEFSRDGAELMDVTFRHRIRQPALPRRPPTSSVSGSPAANANVPAKPAAAGAALGAELRERTRQKLPEYMVPSAFVMMDALPLTPNGKIDRRALPAPEPARAESVKREPPKNDVERAILGVLQELLGGGDIGADDNFFAVGANSLIMVQASVRLRSVIGRPGPLIRMFQHPTARALAASLGETPAAPAQAVKESQDRAQARREAMQRLRTRR
jgi:hypothetical protein